MTSGVRPGRLLRRALRTPALLYRARLGWVLDHRFLALTHRGRRTGRRYVTVLEVLRWRGDHQEAIVMSGFGRDAHWYRNVVAGHAELVQIGRMSFAPIVRVLDAEDAAAVLADYERRNRLVLPIVRRVLSRLAGFDYDGSPAARHQLVETLPLIALTARDEAEPPR